MTPSRRTRTVLGLFLVLAVALFFWSQGARTPTPAGEGAPTAGGRLVATYRSEPTNFNRLVAATTAVRMVTLLTQATLLRRDPATGELEPRLAREWKASPDGLTWTIALREGVTFSDGTPFTSADVLFTFQALYDAKVGSSMSGAFRIKDQPYAVRAPDANTVVLTFPAPFGPGLALLESLPILPRHKLNAALEGGTLQTAWNAGVAPAEVVGLGPFMLKEHVAGQRLTFVRNPHFWRRDARGTALPYLDEIQVDIVPQQNAEVLRLQSGDVDLINDGARPEDLTALRLAEQKGQVRLVEAGITINMDPLWFNLNPKAPRAAGRPWIQADAFRRAISLAVNRQAIIDTVYLGLAEPAYGPITKGHGEWYVADLPTTPFDPAQARTLLASLGLADRNGDQILDDAKGQPVRFSVVTQQGHTIRERTMAVVQEHLRQVGITMDIVATDPGAIFNRFGAGDYEAIFFGPESDSFDPASNLDFWLSSGGFHPWNPGQLTPGTEWEAKIDALMQQQATSLDRAERRRLFAEVQRVLAEHLPVLYFAAARVTVPMSARLRGAVPVIFKPPVLWNAEALSIEGTRR